MNASSTRTPFTYFISEKGSFAVVKMSGSMDDSSAPSLTLLHDDLKQRNHVRSVILHVGELTAISGEGLRNFTLLQASLRSAPAELRLAGFSENLKEFLLKMGVVRIPELSETLETALLDLKRRDPRAR